MKKAIIIDTYPNTKEHLDCLEECIGKLKDKGYDLIVTSHLPIPVNIQNNINYMVYDTNNMLLPKNMSPYRWVSTDAFFLKIEKNGHSVAICRNMNNGISLVKSLGYEFFIFMEADNIIHEEDFNRFEIIRMDMFENEKEMFFFKYKQGGDDAYETLIFGGTPHYFIEKAMLPLNADAYVEWISNFVSKDGIFGSRTLEHSFYCKFDDTERILEIDGTSRHILKNSIINKYSLDDYLCEVVPNNINDSFVLFLKNFGDKAVNFMVNGSENILQPRVWSYKFLETGCDISVVILENGEIVGSKIFSVREENREKFREVGILEFK